MARSELDGCIMHRVPTSILYINSLRHRRTIGPGPALPAGQSPAVGGAGPGPSQKTDWARPGTLWGLGNFRI